MKLFRPSIVAFFAFLICCCSLQKNISVDEPDIITQIKIADSLEAASAIHEAAEHYAKFAEQYPYSNFYKTAVLKAAHLYCNPLNTIIDDTSALKWFRTYTALPVSSEEKEHANLFIALLNRIITLQNGIENLSSYSKKQSQELNSRSIQIRDLEIQLEQTKGELDKLREIDVNIQKRGTKK